MIKNVKNFMKDPINFRYDPNKPYYEWLISYIYNSIQRLLKLYLRFTKLNINILLFLSNIFEIMRPDLSFKFFVPNFSNKLK